MADADADAMGDEGEMDSFEDEIAKLQKDIDRLELEEEIGQIERNAAALIQVFVRARNARKTRARQKMAELSRLLQGKISKEANVLSDDVIRSISPFIAALDQGDDALRLLAPPTDGQYGFLSDKLFEQHPLRMGWGVRARIRICENGVRVRSRQAIIQIQERIMSLLEFDPELHDFLTKSRASQQAEFLKQLEVEMDLNDAKAKAKAKALQEEEDAKHLKQLEVTEDHRRKLKHSPEHVFELLKFIVSMTWGQYQAIGTSAEDNKVFQATRIFGEEAKKRLLKFARLAHDNDIIVTMLAKGTIEGRIPAHAWTELCKRVGEPIGAEGSGHYLREHGLATGKDARKENMEKLQGMMVTSPCQLLSFGNFISLDAIGGDCKCERGTLEEEFTGLICFLPPGTWDPKPGSDIPYAALRVCFRPVEGGSIKAWQIEMTRHPHFLGWDAPIYVGKQTRKAHLIVIDTTDVEMEFLSRCFNHARDGIPGEMTGHQKYSLRHGDVVGVPVCAKGYTGPVSRYLCVVTCEGDQGYNKASCYYNMFTGGLRVPDISSIARGDVMDLVDMVDAPLPTMMCAAGGTEEAKECCICLEDLGLDVTSCGDDAHGFCLDCLKKHLLESGQVTLATTGILGCPDPDCDRHIPEDNIFQMFAKDPTIPPLYLRPIGKYHVSMELKALKLAEKKEAEMTPLTRLLDEIADVLLRGCTWQCPDCGVHGIKDAACIHMTCVCTKTWCYACGRLSDECLRGAGGCDTGSSFIEEIDDWSGHGLSPGDALHEFHRLRCMALLKILKEKTDPSLWAQVREHSPTLLNDTPAPGFSIDWDALEGPCTHPCFGDTLLESIIM